MKCSKRTLLLTAVSLFAIQLASKVEAWNMHGFTLTQPSNVLIPVSTFGVGNLPVNNFPGFVSPATSVFLSGSTKFLKPNPDNDLLVCTTIGIWRDQQITSYAQRGTFFLRLSGSPGSQTALFCTFNNDVPGGDIRIGIISGFDETKCVDPSCGNGIPHSTYVNTNVAASAEGIAVGYSTTFAGQTLTFGCNGFNVYLLYNNQVLWSYTEWRLMNYGRMAIWAHQSLGCTDITATYFNLKSLFSNVAASIYDPRDFGMRAVANITGSISSGSNQLTIASNVGFQVGDTVLVATGGEAGTGQLGTNGVGGFWPPLSYATLAAMNADTTKPNGTWAAVIASGLVYTSSGGVWSRVTDGSGINNQGFYTAQIVPLALVSKITAITPNGLTLTLANNAITTTVNASVYLDCLPSFFVLTNNPIDNYNPLSNITFSVPAGTWVLSGPMIQASRNDITYRTGTIFTGAGTTQTQFFAPMGAQGIQLDISWCNNAIFKNFNILSNQGAFGYGYAAGTSQGGASVPAATQIGFSSNGIFQNINYRNIFSCCIEQQVTNNCWAYNCNLIMDQTQYAYSGWQFQSSDGTGGGFQDCQVTSSPALLKAFETFAGDSVQFIRCGGQNACWSTNSSKNWSFLEPVSIITANSKPANNPQGLDEPIMSISNHAFGTGTTGLIRNPVIKQLGYIDAAKNSLKAIQIEPNQTDVTITGQYPGGAGCTNTLLGYFEAPNYDAGSAEYGAMAIYSDAARTIISGIRSVGTAIGTPGHSGHFGNISALGVSSSVTNSVADVIQIGPTQSGNQTNLAYCP